MPRSIYLKTRMSIFYFRLDNNKNRNTFKYQNNLILIKRHFRSNGHILNRDTKFIILERNEKKEKK